MSTRARIDCVFRNLLVDGKRRSCDSLLYIVVELAVMLLQTADNQRDPASKQGLNLKPSQHMEQLEPAGQFCLLWHQLGQPHTDWNFACLLGRHDKSHNLDGVLC